MAKLFLIRFSSYETSLLFISRAVINYVKGEGRGFLRLKTGHKSRGERQGTLYTREGDGTVCTVVNQL